MEPSSDINTFQEVFRMYVDYDYSQSLLKGLNELRQRHILCDVELKVNTECNGHGILAHRAVLSACSRYFKAMFAGKLKESRKYAILLHQIDANSLQDIVDFAYTGNIAITQNNVQDLFASARMLQLDKIVEACRNFLESQLHPSNCLGILRFADLHSCTMLLNSALTFIESHFTDIVTYDEFGSLEPHLLEKILKTDNLNVTSEKDVLYALEHWVLYNPKKHLQCLPKLTPLLRLNNLTSDFLSKYLKEGMLLPLSRPLQRALEDTFKIKDDPKRLHDNRIELWPLERRAPTHLMVVGGKNGLLSISESCEYYEPWTDRWHIVSGSKWQRTDSAASGLNGKCAMLMVLSVYCMISIHEIIS